MNNLTEGAAGKREGKRRPRPFWLALILFLEAFACLSWFVPRREDYRYGIGYETTPLVMKSISVINRQGQRDAWDLGENQDLYEVRITYENPSKVTGEFSGGPDFMTGEDGFYLYEASPASGDDLYYEVRYTQKIPAGCTGTFSRFLEVDRGTETIRIEERAERMFGSRQSVLLELPRGDGARTEWTAQE